MVTLGLRIGDARGFSGDQSVAKEIRKHVAQMGHAANISALRIKVNWYYTGIIMNAARHPTSTLMFSEASEAGQIVAKQLSNNAVLAKELAKLILRSEEHTSELQSLMRTSYAVFCLK